MAKKKGSSSKQVKTEAKSAQKSTTILALKRPSPPHVIEKSVEDVVISQSVSTETLVSDDASPPLPLSEKPIIEVAKNTLESTDITPPVESVTESIQSDPDPLIGTQIEVTAPWGGKVRVEVAGVYFDPSGDKWVNFQPLVEAPSGWTWFGGVKRLNKSI